MGRWAAGEEARAVVGPGGAGRARALLQKRTELLHGPGIEPGPPAWQARILPLNHPCTGGRCRPTLPQRGWPPTAGQRFLLARGLLLPLSRRRTPVACKRGSGPRGGPQGAALSGGLEAGTEGRRVGGSAGRRVGGAEAHPAHFAPSLPSRAAARASASPEAATSRSRLARARIPARAGDARPLRLSAYVPLSHRCPPPPPRPPPPTPSPSGGRLSGWCGAGGRASELGLCGDGERERWTCRVCQGCRSLAPKKRSGRPALCGGVRLGCVGREAQALGLRAGRGGGDGGQSGEGGRRGVVGSGRGSGFPRVNVRCGAQVGGGRRPGARRLRVGAGHPRAVAGTHAPGLRPGRAPYRRASRKAGLHVSPEAGRGGQWAGKAPRRESAARGHAPHADPPPQCGCGGQGMCRRAGRPAWRQGRDVGRERERLAAEAEERLGGRAAGSSPRAAVRGRSVEGFPHAAGLRGAVGAGWGGAAGRPEPGPEPEPEPEPE